MFVAAQSEVCRSGSIRHAGRARLLDGRGVAVSGRDEVAAFGIRLA
jgi:hypothetical protein